MMMAYKLMTRERPLMDDGMVPESWLSFRYRYTTLRRLPMEDGMVPESWLSNKPLCSSRVL